MENLFKILKEFGDSFAIQDDTILQHGTTYHFTKKNDFNVYKGKFNKVDKFGYTIFDNVEIYNGFEYQKYTNKLSSSYIDKIYYL